MGEFNLHTIPAREMSPRRLEEAVDCLPMMAPRTLVLVRDFDLFKAGRRTGRSMHGPLPSSRTTAAWSLSMT